MSAPCRVQSSTRVRMSKTGRASLAASAASLALREESEPSVASGGRGAAHIRCRFDARRGSEMQGGSAIR